MPDASLRTEAADLVRRPGRFLLLLDRVRDLGATRIGEDQAGEQDQECEPEIGADRRHRGVEERKREGDAQIIGVEAEILADRLADAEEGIVAGEDVGVGKWHFVAPFTVRAVPDPLVPFPQHEPCQFYEMAFFQHLGRSTGAEGRTRLRTGRQYLGKAASRARADEPVLRRIRRVPAGRAGPSAVWHKRRSRRAARAEAIGAPRSGRRGSPTPAAAPIAAEARGRP